MSILYNYMSATLIDFLIFLLIFDKTNVFQRGEQRLSRTAVILLILTWLFAIVTLFLSVGHVITWLTYLYYFSYIKLGISIIKYIPQVCANNIITAGVGMGLPSMFWKNPPKWNVKGGNFVIINYECFRNCRKYKETISMVFGFRHVEPFIL